MIGHGGMLIEADCNEPYANSQAGHVCVARTADGDNVTASLPWIRTGTGAGNPGSPRLWCQRLLQPSGTPQTSPGRPCSRATASAMPSPRTGSAGRVDVALPHWGDRQRDVFMLCR